MSMDFEPDIIGLVCNSSGFMTSRTTTTAKGEVRPYRMEVLPVDCVGSVPTTLVTSALEKGADAVLIIACGDGLCHYFDGERRLETKLEMVRTLAEDMGLESERIFFYKVPDRQRALVDGAMAHVMDRLEALGPSPMKTQDAPRMEKGLNIWPAAPLSLMDAGKGAIEGLWDEARRTGVVQCLECGKCTASCPVATMKPDFSPMYLIEKALRADGHEVKSSPDYWNCLTCANCSHRCPSKVDFVEFVRHLRTNVDVRGGICTHGGVLDAIWRMQAFPQRYRDQDRMSWVTQDLDVSEVGDVLYFVGCLPYFDVIFEKLGFKGGEEIARNVVRILNAAGISPVVLPNEMCCGHDALWNGDFDLFRGLAKQNFAEMTFRRARTIICSCPECYRTLKVDYARFFDLDVEVKHISEVILELIEQGKLVLSKEAREEVRRFTYHDPCRLVRHTNVVEEPRKVMASLPGTELVEMERGRELSTCCGTSCWANCNAVSERIRADRLREVQATGVDEVITACPKCQIHFRCTLSAKPGTRGLEPGLKVTDLVTLVAGYLGGDGR
jgi:heterodisulfide reductase subunit D